MTPLLISPYLGPTDAARLACRLQFMTGFTLGMALGWCLSLGWLAYPVVARAIGVP
jgi:hypothetical protein